ncbi:MAG: hypothetical protein U0939_13075 [Pirellulales bacterium]
MATVSTLYALVVLLLGLALLMLLTIRGKSIFVVAPACALLTVTLSGVDPVATMSGPYLKGFSDYLRDFYLVFALGAAFGKLLEDSGAAAAIADRIGRWFGARRACLAVVAACAVLTYGGVSLFVVGFSVYPLAVRLFRAADLPRRFIPAAMAFGSVTFTMTSAGSPEIQNLIPIKHLIDAQTLTPLTDARAGWPASLVVALGMFAAGQWYLERALRRAVASGERWEDRDRDAPAREASEGSPAAPSFLAAILPLGVTLASLNLLPLTQRWTSIPEDPNLAIFLGIVAALVCLPRSRQTAWSGLGEGFVNGLIAIGATASVVGFGASVKGLPAFQQIVAWVTKIPGDPLVGAAIAVAVIAAIAGSASGGQGIALPILKPIYVDQLGVAPRALHRVVAISSGTLDSLPANGYVVMLVRNICGETHERAYGPIFVTTVVIPLVGAAAAIGLFKLFPAWATM